MAGRPLKHCTHTQHDAVRPQGDRIGVEGGRSLETRSRGRGRAWGRGGGLCVCVMKVQSGNNANPVSLFRIPREYFQREYNLGHSADHIISVPWRYNSPPVPARGRVQ